MIDLILERLRKASEDGDVNGFVVAKNEAIRAGFTIHGKRILDCVHDWKHVPDSLSYFRCKTCEAMGRMSLHEEVLPVLCTECSSVAVRWFEGSPRCRECQ